MNARKAGVTLLAITGALHTCADEARAEEKQAFTIGSQPAWYLMGGPTGGGTLLAHGSGYVGGEVSVVRLREGRFLGLYGDNYYDFGLHRTYATSGIEGGYKFIGIDAGAASRLGGDRIEWGATGRIFITVGLVSFYARYAYFPDPIGRDNRNVVEIGGLLKMPFATWGGK